MSLHSLASADSQERMAELQKRQEIYRTLKLEETLQIIGWDPLLREGRALTRALMFLPLIQGALPCLNSLFPF